MVTYAIDLQLLVDFLSLNAKLYNLEMRSCIYLDTQRCLIPPAFELVMGVAFKEGQFVLGGPGVGFVPDHERCWRYKLASGCIQVGCPEGRTATRKVAFRNVGGCCLLQGRGCRETG